MSQHLSQYWAFRKISRWRKNFPYLLEFSMVWAALDILLPSFTIFSVNHFIDLFHGCHSRFTGQILSAHIHSFSSMTDFVKDPERALPHTGFPVQYSRYIPLPMSFPQINGMQYPDFSPVPTWFPITPFLVATLAGYQKAWEGKQSILGCEGCFLCIGRNENVNASLSSISWTIFSPDWVWNK